VNIPASSAASLTFGGLVSFDGQTDRVQGPELLAAAFRISSLQKLPTGEFSLSLGAPDGKGYLIETSTNLQNWLPLGRFANTDGALRFRDSQQSPHAF
jgi:hypothetical protein